MGRNYCHNKTPQGWIFSQPFQDRKASLYPRHGCLWYEPAVQATCDDQKGPRSLAWMLRVPTKPTKYPHSFLGLLPNQPCVCTPGLRNRHRAVWCQSGLPGLQCHRVDHNSLGTAAVLHFNCKALRNSDLPVHQV